MAGMCCGINVPESEPTSPVEASARTTRRRRIQLRQLRVISDKGDKQVKRQKVMSEPNGEDDINDDLNQPARECRNAIENCSLPVAEEVPKYGFTSVCGKRRDMEDAVSTCPSFYRKNERNGNDGCEKLDFYGVFDGHGCSHVAKKCKERMHEIIREEIENGDSEWKDTMTRSYIRMDKEVTERVATTAATTTSPAVSCRCELQSPQCDAVGSTAVVAVVTPDKIIISNCGDSRAVICRNGVAIPLTSDHKPDRPDELSRIEEAGGRVIYWDGARVLGMLAMSRAIGDNYLKPYVIPDPEVTVLDRTSEDECLILASDGLWDVMSNHTAVSVARMCLKAKRPPPPPGNDGVMGAVGEGSDKACSEASILLTKLALARRSCDNVSVVVVDLRRNGL